MFLLASFIFTSCLGSPLPNNPLPIPLENTTALNLEVTGAWYPSSPTRGTADVLYSCALTLSLCVYTAIHLNVPNPNEPKWKQSLRKAKWVSIGIIAPEVVLHTALQQWSSARGLFKALSKLTDSKSEIYRFDMTYCFFAVMGGFIVDISNLHDDYKYLTLTPQAILYLAENGYYIVPGTSIKDKSKSDSLGKVLVCLQMTWLITQCVVRKVYGYPIFLLELHTFVHAICALLNKPQDVCDPTIVDTSKYEDILAQGMMVTISLSPSLSPQDEKDSMNDHDETVTESNLWTAFDFSDVDSTPPPGSNSTTIHALTGNNTIRKVCSQNSLKNSSRKE